MKTSPASRTTRKHHPFATGLTYTAILLAMAVAAQQPATADTHYVSPSGSHTHPYADWAAAANDIQSAIDAATPGDIVLVTNGFYNTGGRAADGYNTTTRVIITNSVAVWSVSTDPADTIISGTGDPSGAYDCGDAAVRCVYMGDGATLSGFTLTNGHTRGAFAVANDRDGGGIWCQSTNPVVSHCILAGNSAYSYAGGMRNGTAENCAFLGNRAQHYGGGIASGVAKSCTLSGNSAPDYGGGMMHGIANNCILWGNTSANGQDQYNTSCRYTCSPGLSGDGNITDDPQFVDAAGGNYRLKRTSRCLNAGDNDTVTSLEDLDGNPRVFNITLDMGAYECQALPAAHVTYVRRSNPDPVAPYNSWNTAATNIQDAVDCTAADGICWVTNGLYDTGGRPAAGHTLTNRVLIANGIAVRAVSDDPADTVISGAEDPSGGRGPGAVRCALLEDGAVLSGFTLINGHTETDTNIIERAGGGGAAVGTDAMVSNCVVDGCSADFGGGIICYNGGRAVTATVSRCHAKLGGGTYVQTEGYLTNCWVTECTAPNGAGLQCAGGGKAFNCTFTNNTALTPGGLGGGVRCDSGGTLQNCVVVDNHALRGAGVYLYNGGYLQNCDVLWNKATNDGGGVVFFVGGAVANSIVYYNSPENWDDVFGGDGDFRYTCTTPLPSGIGNIDDEPDLADGGLRLRRRSPCIDAGDNDAAPPKFDKDWKDRVVDGDGDAVPDVDMGAFEFDPADWSLLTVAGSPSEIADSAPYDYGEHELAAGAAVTNTATSPLSITNGARWSCRDWAVEGGTPASGSGDTAVYTLDGNATQTWLWVTEYYLDVELGGNGSGTVDVGDGWHTNGATVTLTATPVEGHALNGWLGDLAPEQTTDNPLVLTMDQARTVTAHFKIITDTYVWTNSLSSRWPYDTWVTAAHSIQDAVNAVVSTGTVHVREGTYTLATNVFVDEYITLRSVSGADHTTIDGGGNTRCVHLQTRAAIEGFTITGGSADQGAGVYMSNGGDVRHCVISNNTAGAGAGVYMGGIASVSHCTVRDNIAAGGSVGSRDGGGIFINGFGHNTVVRNCNVFGNHADDDGGGIYCNSAGLVEHCTVTGNSAEHGGGVAKGYTGVDTLVRGCIVVSNTVSDGGPNLWNSPEVEYSCASPLPPGPGNIDAEPLFADYAGGDYRLQRLSPCVNAAVNRDWMTNSTDLEGQDRIIGVVVDMGADEYDDDFFPSLTVNGDPEERGEPLPYGYGTHYRAQGTLVANSVATPADESNGVRFVCRGWTGTGSAPPAGADNEVTFLLETNSTLTWLWTTNYLLDTEVAGPGIVDVRDSWYTNGAVVTLTATPYDGHAFSEWQGDVPPGQETNNPLTIVVDGPMNLTAVFPFGNAVHYVDLNSPNPTPPYASWDTAAASLQPAVNAASDGALVLVAPGIYALSSQVVISDEITLAGFEGAASTIVDGQNQTSCIRISGANATLDGFTVQNGMDSASGAVELNGDCSPTMRGCIIANNDCGGIAATLAAPLVEDCTIVSNAAPQNGGGIHLSNSADSPTFVRCRITGNTAGNLAGGVYASWCDLVMENCLVAGNAATNYHGGIHLYKGSPSLRNCTVAGNSAPAGGGLSCQGSTASVVNCIMWGNAASQIHEDSGGTATVTYSTVQGGRPGTGNLDGDPLFLDPAGGDYRVSADSPCVNAGNTGEAATPTDLDGLLRIHADAVDMGAYENHDPPPAAAPVTYVWQASPDPSAPYDSWSNAAHDIQSAIDYTAASGTVWVTNGVYDTGGRVVEGYTLTNRVIITNGIAVRAVSINPSDTVIAGAEDPAGPFYGLGGAAIRGVYMADDTMLCGFMIADGTTDNMSMQGADRSGGGIYCEGMGALVTNCVLIGCAANDTGGGVMRGTLHNCTLSGNYGYDGGGCRESVLSYCTLSSNSAGFGGGTSHGTLHNCTLFGNTGDQGGGSYGGTLSNCTLSDNDANSGGGGSHGSTLSNCVLSGNHAGGGSGGSCQSTLYNCTVTGNSTDGNGGGVESGSAYNSIVYFNSAATGGQDWHSDATPICEHTCTTPDPGTGPGNITSDPVFENAGAGNFELRSSSPCIDTGNNAYVTTTNDLIGNPRIFNGTVDMGAYELQQVPLALVTYVWQASPDPREPYDTWDTAAHDIQSAVDYTAPSGTVWVTNGVYDTGGRVADGYTLTNRVVITSSITVQAVSASPADTVIVGASDPSSGFFGPGAIRSVYMSDGTTLSGFTVTNGHTHSEFPSGVERSGGGIFCEGLATLVTNCVVQGCEAYDSGGGSYGGTLRACTLAGNNAEYGGGSRGSVLNDCALSSNSAYYGGASCEGVLSNCTLSENTAFLYGGGSYQAVLHDCMLSKNSAGDSGGGSYDSTLDNCTLQENSAVDDGGGNYGGSCSNCTLIYNTAADGGGSCWAALFGCEIYGNVAADEGGGDYDGSLVNCTLGNNYAEGHGGGSSGGSMDNCLLWYNHADVGGGATYPSMRNCTVVDNSANQYAGGIYEGNADNCIVYFNSAGTDGDNWYSGVPPVFVYGCTTPDPGGTGNTTNEPQFVDMGANNYRLLPTSPCVDMGNNGYVPWPTDLDGNTRIFNGIVDMGAYEVQQVPPAPVTYVWQASPDPRKPYDTWDTAAHDIQSAVDYTAPSGTVWVTNGVYDTGGRIVDGYTLTNRVVVDRPITLHAVSTDPADTVIMGAFDPVSTNGPAAVRCVFMTQGSTLRGFTITGGHTCATNAPQDRDRSGGGILADSYPAPLVENCVITGNSCTLDGGGAYCVNLTNCTLIGNSAGPAATGESCSGGGAYAGRLDNCLVVSNRCDGIGGGVAICDVHRCTFRGNWASYYGGGAAACGHTGHALNNCLFVNNRAEQIAGGAWNSYLYNCTLVGNEAGMEGGGLFTCRDTVNTIVYGNSAPTAPNYNQYTLLDYCCTTPLPGSGTGNIAADPQFVDAAAGNYRLQPTSPCIDAGDNAHTPGPADFAGNPRIVNGTVDMGAYEVQQVPPAPVTYVWQSSPSPAEPYDTWDTAAHDIQSAVDFTAPSGTVWVTNGVYDTGGRVADGYTLTNRVVIDKPIAVRAVSSDPADTVIMGAADPVSTNGPAAVRCVYLAQGSALRGFTLANGHTCATNAVADNDQRGGGMFGEYPFPLAVDCVIADNSATIRGGGAYSVALTNCTLVRNSAGPGGGGASSQGGGACWGTLDDCLIASNRCEGVGGGAAYMAANRCTFRGNWAAYYGGGAAHCRLNDYTLNNCLFVDNRAEEIGGGVWHSYLYNCTVVDNEAGLQGGGLFTCRDTVNTIVYGNSAPTAPNYNEHTLLDYCCTTPLPGSGAGNMDANPRFIDAAAGNYRLQPTSPCIDMGDNAHAPGTIDLDGNPRIFNGIVDMGAYEVQAVPLAPVTYVWQSSPSPAEPYNTWETAAHDIQTAVDYTAPSGTVWVTNGVYDSGGSVAAGDSLTNRVLIADSITVQAVSSEPADTLIVGAPDPISENGPAAVRCAHLSGNATLRGFTLTNGYTHGSGTLDVEDLRGGGAWCENTGSLIANCVLAGNTAFRYGGGAFGGRLNDCIIAGNTVRVYNGGGAASCALNGCTVTGNTANRAGGATSECNVYNSLLSGNSASVYGGGMYSGYALGCTIVDNTCGTGAGIYGVELRNSIIYYNNGENWLYNCRVFDSCTTPLPGSGFPGNIIDAPQFVAAAAGDYRLLPGSPGIDDGNNAYPPPGRTIIDGDGNGIAVVDMGYFEAPLAHFLDTEIAGNGSVNVGDSWHADGTEVTLGATPEPGFAFTHWSGDVPAGQETVTPLTVVMDQSRIITAHFECRIAATHACAGYWSPGTNLVDCTLFFPSNVPLDGLIWVPELPEGWVLTDAAGDGTPEAFEDLIWFLDAPTNSPALFSYEVVVPDGEHGPRQLGGSVEFFLDDMMDYAVTRATPDPLDVTSLHTLTVVSAHGAPDPAQGVHAYPHGANVTGVMNGSPDPGATGTQYVCTGWLGSGSVPASGSVLDTSLIITNDSVLAWQWKTQYLLMATADANGTVTASNGWYDAGTSNVIVTADPAEGYHFAGWTGDIVSSNSTLSLTMDRAYTIQANFEINTYYIIATAGSNGTIAPSGTLAVTHGTDAMFVVTPDPHYHVLDVAVDGASVGPTGSYDFVNIVTGHTIHATFEIDAHSLLVESAYGLPEPPAGTHYYDYGSGVTGTVAEATVAGPTGVQYVCTGWTGSGSVPPSGSGHSVGVVITNDSTITWLWKTQYWFEATAQAGGSVVASNGWYDVGNPATAEATASSGFLFAGWTNDVPGGTATSNPVTVAMDQPRSILALFDIDATVLYGTQDCDGFYSPGPTNGLSTNGIVSCTFHYPGDQTLLALEWRPELPSGWVLVSAAGNGDPVVAGGAVVLTSETTNNPVEIAFAVDVPGDEAVSNTLTATASFQFAGMPATRELDSTPDPLPLYRYHSADYTTPLWRIRPREMILVRMYWRRGGSYHVEPGAPDGYDDRAGDTNGGRHSADYQAPFWKIDAQEMHRVMAYLRARGHHVDLTSVDGYAPGPWPAGPPSPAPPPDAGTLASDITGTYAYDPGTVITITNVVAFDNGLLSLLITPDIPAGWSVLSVAAKGDPELVRNDILWTEDLPSSPVTVVYTVQTSVRSYGRRSLGSESSVFSVGHSDPVAVVAAPVTVAMEARDEDGDGLPDGWERHFGGADGDLDPQADNDGDRMTNLEECIAGTDPTDNTSVLRITGVTLQPGGNARLEWTSEPERNYDVLTTPGLVRKPFAPVIGDVPATPPVNAVSVPEKHQGTGLFRVQIRP